jgi:hypothetical protein
MSEKMRDRRRRDVARVKARMVWLLRHYWAYRPEQITAIEVGKMAAMHETHADCHMCNNQRSRFGPRFSERRRIAETEP